jgi:glutathione peroxidase
MKIFLTSLIAFYFLTVSIYSLQYNKIDGTTQPFNQFQGKKILIVNIATGSTRVNQIGELQQLQNLYPDSLVVIGFPSNSFGHEPLADSAIQQFCQTNYNATFRLASKQSVRGADIQTVYHWLTTIADNGVMDSPVQSDFQKFLISETGEIIGVFSPIISPLSNDIKNAISNN